VSTSPIPSPEAIEDHYRRRFAKGNYELRRRYAEQYQLVDRQYLKILQPLVSAARPSILDVGCFTGDLLSLLAAHGWDVYGLELQPEAVRIARERLPGRVYQADVHGKDFPELQFDVVSMLGLIEHVVDPVQMIRRGAELVRPGGVLLVQTPDSGSILARVMGRLWPMYEPVEHIHVFTRRALTTVFSQVGLTDVKIRTHVKPLSFDYVWQMLANFGPEIRRLLTPLYRMTPAIICRRALPFYVGEFIATARKPGLSSPV
jgi:SAM-dependent methyltransferase